MEIVSLIFNGLALAVALAILILFIREKKVNAKRRTDLMNYFGVELQSTFAALQDISEDHFREVREAQKEIMKETMHGNAGIKSSVLESRAAFHDDISGFRKRIKDLEEGICPDYNAAMDAKNAVDDFSKGIMGILTYGNPVTPKKSRDDEEDD